MRKLVQSDKAIKILSDPSKSSDVRKAIQLEKSNVKVRHASSGSITIRRIGKK